MGIRRYGRSAYRKGRRLYKWGRANPKQAMALARSAWKGVQTIRGLVNSEMFHKTNTYTLGSNTSKIHPLNHIAQGDGVDFRTGNSILVKRLVMNGYMYINSSQTSNTRVMLAIVLDKQQVSDTTPSITDIFSSAGDPSTLLNVNNTGRFKIVWRRQYTMEAQTVGSSSKQLKLFKRFHFHTRYNGTADTDIQKNGLYLVMITSEPSLYPVININARLSYHDN